MKTKWLGGLVYAVYTTKTRVRITLDSPEDIHDLSQGCLSAIDVRFFLTDMPTLGMWTLVTAAPPLALAADSLRASLAHGPLTARLALSPPTPPGGAPSIHLLPD